MEFLGLFLRLRRVAGYLSERPVILPAPSSLRKYQQTIGPVLTGCNKQAQVIWLQTRRPWHFRRTRAIVTLVGPCPLTIRLRKLLDTCSLVLAHWLLPVEYSPDTPHTHKHTHTCKELQSPWCSLCGVVSVAWSPWYGLHSVVSVVWSPSCNLHGVVFVFMVWSPQCGLRSVVFVV